ncbi:MAG: glycosyltransferase [Nitrososphaerota archaeon]|nr:hypothetical protein [Candidatus Bathyarchaeota archaeon]MDW8048799.1 glycosyltransferase [Nitrososphaerota archaeon]
MKVYFGVCGLGFGHVGRCVPIARHLAKYGAEVLFSTYGDAVEYLKQEGLPFFEAPPIEFRVKPDGTVDFRQTVANPGPFLASLILTHQIECEIKYMRAFKPDVVVSDSRVSPLLAARALNIPDVCILNQFQIIIPRRSRLLRLAKLVDTGALAIIGKIWTSGSGYLLIPDFPPPYTLSAGNLRIPNAYQKRVELIGPILPVRPEELPSKDEIRQRLGFDINLPLVLISISGPVKERAYIAQVLQNIALDFPDNYQVVVSLGNPGNSAELARKKNVVVYSWIPNRFEFLKACDILISRAGHGTLTQGIIYGKPLILIPTPSHTEQINNAKRAYEMGIAKVLEQESVNKETIIDAVMEMLTDQEYRRNVEEIRRVVARYDGLKTAVEIISKIAAG